jgi:transcriptional regulator with XRE-family HTH domain
LIRPWVKQSGMCPMSRALTPSRIRRKRVVLCRLLAKARNDARLTQAVLARKLARPQSFVSKYERCGRRLDVVEFMQVCTVIGCDAAAILRTVSKGDAPA